MQFAEGKSCVPDCCNAGKIALPGVGAGRAGGLDMTRQRWTLAGISKRGMTSFGRLNEGCPEGGEIRNLPPLTGSFPPFLPGQERGPPEAFPRNRMPLRQIMSKKSEKSVVLSLSATGALFPEKPFKFSSAIQTFPVSMERGNRGALDVRRYTAVRDGEPVPCWRQTGKRLRPN